MNSELYKKGFIGLYVKNEIETLFLAKSKAKTTFTGLEWKEGEKKNK